MKGFAGGGKHRTIRAPDAMWTAARRAAYVRSVAEGHTVPLAETIRRGLAREIAEVERGDDYEMPPTVAP